VVVRLLLGLIFVLVAFAVVRALAPARAALAGTVLGAGAVVLLALYRQALMSVEFWAGLIGFAAILSALLIVIHPNPMVSVLFLILNLFCVALFYLMLQGSSP